MLIFDNIVCHAVTSDAWESLLSAEPILSTGTTASLQKSLVCTQISDVPLAKRLKLLIKCLRYAGAVCYAAILIGALRVLPVRQSVCPSICLIWAFQGISYWNVSHQLRRSRLQDVKNL